MKKIFESIVVIACLLPIAHGVSAGAGHSQMTGLVGMQPEPKKEASIAAKSDLFVTLRVPLFLQSFADTPVARVNDEVITLGQFTDNLVAMHSSGAAEEGGEVKHSYGHLLDRMITAKLVAAEARNIGFDELPEFQEKTAERSLDLQMSMVMNKHLKDLKLEEQEIDKLYRSLARELRVSSLEFKEEKEALSFQEQYKAGGDFVALATKFIADGKATGSVNETDYVKLKELLPNVASTAYEMSNNTLSQIFTLEGGFMIFYLHDSRFVEDESVKAEAQQKLMSDKRKFVAAQYVAELKKKYSKIDEELVKEVDFAVKKTGSLWFKKEEPVDYKQLLVDPRVLATVKDLGRPEEAPYEITVSSLAKELEGYYFHGAERAQKDAESMNLRKETELQNMIFKQVIMLEARNQDIENDEYYIKTMRQFEEGLLFDLFIKKVVAPDIKISDEEVKAYYEQNIKDFSSPALVGMNGLIFANRKDAENTLATLRKGADFKWVSANAAGQVSKSEPNVLVFDDRLISEGSVPAELKHHFNGATPGDTFVYTENGFHYVFVIKRVIPSKATPYQEVSSQIAKILFGQKMEQVLSDWHLKLKEAYQPEIYFTEFN